VEVGARGVASASWRWSAALYRTDLENDIAFISAGAGATNAGFFANVGTTRRQGLELGLETRLDPIALAVRYTFLDATFRSAFSESSPANSSADAEGNIEVQSGDRIPSNPRHVLKVRAEWTVTPQFSLGANVLTSDGVYARGDENNQDANGQLPGYALVNLDARYLLSSRFEIFARVNNVFDRRYFNFGVVGENFFTGPDRTFGPQAGMDPSAEQFRGPGMPRGVWVSVRYSFGARSSPAAEPE
jgi:outer membrane receptor protein involved in Fe transport